MQAPEQIHVARRTVQLGVFTAEEVLAGLASGRFLPTDLAWTNGQAAWKPLSEWPEFAAAPAPAAPTEGAPIAGEPLSWEKSRSLRSAWVSFTEILLRPSPALTLARLDLGAVLPLAWTMAAIGAVFFIVGGSLHAEANAAYSRQQAQQVLDAIRQSKGEMSFLMPWVESMSQAKPMTTSGLAIQAGLLVLLGPLLNSLLGLWVWLGLRLFGLFGVDGFRRADLGRTVGATVLGLAALGLVFAPVSLLPSTVGALLGFPVLVGMVFLVSRAVGAANRLGAWSVGFSLLVSNFLACCLLGLCLGGLLALVFA